MKYNAKRKTQIGSHFLEVGVMILVASLKKTQQQQLNIYSLHFYTASKVGSHRNPMRYIIIWSS